MGKDRFRDFIRAYWPNWFALVSGSPSVPAAYFAYYAQSDLAKIALWVTSGVCVVLSAFFIWRAERRRVMALASRLAPRIRLDLNPNNHGVLTIPANYPVQNGESTERGVSKWIQVRVAPITDMSLEGCEARLVSCKRLNADGTPSDAELEPENVFCRWSMRSEHTINIPAGTEWHANLFKVFDRAPNLIHPEIETHIALEEGIQHPGRYRVSIVISANGAPSVKKDFIMNWKSFDEVSISEAR